MLRIGGLQLATNLLLAPVAGYCDLSLRLVARSCGGVGLACTELLCPKGVLRGNYRSRILSMTCPQDSPLCMQFYGAADDPLCEAARWAEDHGAHVVDINMGCPVDKITRQDGGSRLLCDPDGTLRMVEKIIRSLRRVPLTAKMRLGWDDSSIVAPYLARRLEEIGVAMVTVHGRTAQMQFSGEVRLDGIAQVVAAVRRIPVIGNGDVRRPQDAKRMIDATGCAGVMIGRAAISQPWIFRDTHSYLTTGAVPPPLTIEQKCRLMREHFDHLCRFRCERVAIIEFRNRISWYAKTMHPCRYLKQRMRLMRSRREFVQTLERFVEWRRRYDQDVAAGRVKWMAEAMPEEPAQAA